MNNQNPKRVLHVLGQLNQGGVENRLMDLYRKIDRHRLQFDFVVHGDEKGYFYEEIQSLGGRIYHVPRFNGINVRSYRVAWIRLLENIKEIQIVHGHVTSTSYFYMKVAKNKGIEKRIIHARAENKGPILKRIFTRLSRFHANEFLGVSRIAARSTFGQKKGAKALILPNAIDVDKYIFEPEQRHIYRTKLDLDSHDVLYLHVGRFTHQKNHFFLINLFDQLTKYYSNIKLLLVGEGPLKLKVQSYISKLNLTDKIIFMGPTSDIPQILMAADGLLLPSFYEGFPGIALESQASGLRTFVSDKVTKEIYQTKLVRFLPINKNTFSLWVEALNPNGYAQNEDRKASASIIRDSLFHIENLINKYYELYEVDFS